MGRLSDLVAAARAAVYTARVKLRGVSPRAAKTKFIPLEERRRYIRQGNNFICKDCHTLHGFLPYVCRGCGKRLMDYADDKTIEEFWSRLHPSIRPDRDMYQCGFCGSRRKNDVTCNHCQHNTPNKKRVYGLPNVEVIDEFTIRCGKCLRTQVIKRKIGRNSMCIHCHNHFQVAQYRQDFTAMRPIVVDSFDEGLATPAIQKKADRAMARYVHQRQMLKAKHREKRKKAKAKPPMTAMEIQLKEEW